MKPTLNDVINLSIDNRLNSLHTAIPAVVTKYDAKKQMASVKPSIKTRYIDGSAESLPVVVNCPVIFPAGGGGMLSFPVKQGDRCLLLFCEQSLDVWLSKGGEVDPLDRRRFNLSDGIVIMGLFSVPDAGNADPENVVLQNDGGAKLNLNADGKIALGNSNEELLSLLDDLISELLVTTVATSIGTQPFINAANYATLQTRLGLLKGTL